MGYVYIYSEKSFLYNIYILFVTYTVKNPTDLLELLIGCGWIYSIDPKKINMQVFCEIRRSSKQSIIFAKFKIKIWRNSIKSETNDETEYYYSTEKYSVWE